MPTPSIEELRNLFRIPGVTIDAGLGGLTRLRVATRLCTGELYLQGAHLTAFQPAGHDPVLWVSSRSAFAPGKAIRGGVPICYPWFGSNPADPSLPQHGFARTSTWDLLEVADQPDGSILCLLRLPPRVGSDEAEANIETHFAIAFGQTLGMSLSVRNNGRAEYRFEAALHTYFTVGDVHQVSIGGLQGTRYIDKMRSNETFIEADAAVRFIGETDRIYESDADCTIDDPSMDRRISNTKFGSRSTVVWNAWPTKAAAIGLAEGEWEHYCCVETAAIGPDALTVEPGKRVVIGAEIGVRKN